MIRRSPIPTLLLVVLALMAACGASQREDALKATVIGLNSARDTLTTFDHDHKRKILARNPERPGYEAELAAYKAKREPVLEALVAAYRAVGVAAVVSKDEPSLEAARDAAVKFVEAFDTFRKAVAP